MWLYSEVIAIAPDGSRLVGATTGGFVEWDEPTRPSSTPRDCDRTRPYLVTHGIGQIGFSPGGSYFWRAVGSVWLFNAADYTLCHTLADPDYAGALTVAFSQDEKQVCVAFGHRAVIWTLAQPDVKLVKLRGHKQQVRAVGCLPGGNTVLTAGMDGTVRLWDANTGAETRSFDWGIGKVRVAAVSPDGNMCAAGSDDGRLVVWDVDV
jgi:WD40 repeat protein